MLLRTHLAIAAFFVILFLNSVSNKLFFAIIALFAAALPDVDCAFSTAGKSKGLRFLQFFVKHRGPIHSFSFCILLSLLLSFFMPVLAFGFFLGYGIHVFSDSFTKEGITPFWPYLRKSSWIIKTGSAVDSTLFFGFLLLDAVAIVFFLF